VKVNSNVIVAVIGRSAGLWLMVSKANGEAPSDKVGSAEKVCISSQLSADWQKVTFVCWSNVLIEWFHGVQHSCACHHIMVLGGRGGGRGYGNHGIQICCVVTSHVIIIVAVGRGRSRRPEEDLTCSRGACCTMQVGNHLGDGSWGFGAMQYIAQVQGFGYLGCQSLRSGFLLVFSHGAWCDHNYQQVISRLKRF
jgi:hypothetical protein